MYKKGLLMQTKRGELLSLDAFGKEPSFDDGFVEPEIQGQQMGEGAMS